MPNHNSRHKVIGENCSAKQRLTEQLTATQAIILSQKPTNHIPLMVCEHPATWILVDPDCDMEEKRVEWRNIHEPERVVVVGRNSKRHNKLPALKLTRK